MIGNLLHTAYRLRHHRLGEWPLDRCGMTAALVAAAAILLRWVAAGMPAVPALHWGFPALLLAAAAGLLYGGHWARRRMYVIFEPQSDQAPAPRQLDPADKVLVHSTGQFEVADRSQFFADLLAYWRTFGSREHAVMAIVPRSRYLLFGHVSEREIGMWYIFFQPQTIEEIVPGMLAFGRTRRQALRVSYRYTPPAGSKRKPPQPIMRVVYLGFEDDAARQQVWADVNAECKMQNAE